MWHILNIHEISQFLKGSSYSRLISNCKRRLKYLSLLHKHPRLSLDLQVHWYVTSLEKL